MKRIMNKKAVIDELSERTGWFKIYVESFLDTLESIIIENIHLSNEEENSKLTIFTGLVIEGRRVSEREVTDPRTGIHVLSKKNILPCVRFTRAFKDKINRIPEDNECTND